MSLFRNPFTRFCISGFGTRTDAGKAFGITVLIFCFAFIAFFYACKGIYKLVQKRRKKEEPM